MPVASVRADASLSHHQRSLAPIDPVHADQSVADELLRDTNALLAKLGFEDRAFAHTADLVASVSSMSVALYEKLFQFRLRDVERMPRTRQDYEHNAQLVANALRTALLEQGNTGDRIEALTGERLCAGDVGSIRRLLTMLDRVYTLLIEASGEMAETLRDERLASLGTATTTHVPALLHQRVASKLVSKGRNDSVVKSDDWNRTQARDLRRNKTMKGRKKRCQIAASRKQEEVRPGCAVNGRQGKSSRSQRAAAIAENTKKRSRLLEQSVKAIGTPSPKPKRLGDLKGASRSRREQREMDKELLATRKYGRFVSAARSPSSIDGEPHVTKALEDESKRAFFDGVSSVQHNSDESMHFIEDDGALAHDFSSICIEDAEREEEDDEDLAASSRDCEEKTLDEVSTTATQHKMVKQQQDQVDDPLAVSPVKKKVARGEPHAPERPRKALAPRHDKRKSLYPLLSKTNQYAAKSKAHVQYLRYKLTLKNHLQELRQRETCQRQHLERAFKSGEHLATVDKIRSRRFEQDVRLHRLAIGLKAKNEEETQLRQTLHHLLGLEKAKLREEHRLTTSVLKQIKQEHTEREEAMETFYATQIQLVKERTRREVKERELVEKAQRAASDKMMRELRYEKEHQLAALLQAKAHLEETRRFRHASQMAAQLS